MAHSNEVVEKIRPSVRIEQSAASANVSVMARISALAANIPDRPAIVDGSATLPFSELESRSNKLANYLLDVGLGAGSTAVLLLERSADFVIAALAVMKTGAAYVPLDSSTPAERASIVIADAQATLVLTHRKKADNLAAGTARVVELDGGDAIAISEQSGSAPEGRVLRRQSRLCCLHFRIDRQSQGMRDHARESQLPDRVASECVRRDAYRSIEPRRGAGF